jgi:hypothetical protein
MLRYLVNLIWVLLLYKNLWKTKLSLWVLFLSAIYGTKTIQEGSSGTCLCNGVKHTATPHKSLSAINFHKVPGDQEGLFKLAIQLRTFFYSAIYNTATGYVLWVYLTDI